MVATAKIPPGEHVPTADQRVVMHGVPWSHYEVMLALRGEASVPRLAYLEGALELMSPSRDHERIKSNIGRLVEAYAEHLGLELGAYGSWTLKSALAERGADPDECYIVGTDQNKAAPDLAIEVVWTSGGLDKLAIYAKLGVREVWFWVEGQLEVHVLRGEGYERALRSEQLPGVDLELLARFLDRPTITSAVRELRAAFPRG